MYRTQVISEYSPISIKVTTLESFYNEWRVNREKFVNSVVLQFGSFPSLITVSRRTFMLLYCYTNVFGDFMSGNWFHFNTSVWYDYRLEDDEMVLYDEIGIIGITKGIEKQLFNVQI